MKKIKNNFIKIILFTLIIVFGYTIKLNATTIILDPGHGGSDPGAMNNRKNLVEADINYKIAKYLKGYLEEYKDVKVILTRNESTYKTLQQRADVGFNNNADLLISLHINSAESETVTGACTYVTYKTNFDKYNKQCTQISNLILNNLASLGIKNNGTKTRICKDNEYKWLYSDGSHADYYGIIRYCMKGTKGDGPEIELDINSGKGIPAVLVEHCYIKNGDEKYIDTDEDIKKLAKCDSDAIVKYYKLLLKNSTSSNNTNNNTNSTVNNNPNTTVNNNNNNTNSTTNSSTIQNTKTDLSKVKQTINVSNKVYTGKEIKTSIKLIDKTYTLREGTDYTVLYKNNKNTGKATVTITGKENYTGKITKTFKIVPKKTTISKVTNVKNKKAKITWKKDSMVSGYEIYMSTAVKDNKYMKTTTGLKLRKSTSTKSKSLKTIPKGAKVKISKRNVKRYGKYYWYKVTYNGKTGYVHSKYLKAIYKEGKYSKIKTVTSNKSTSYTKTKLKKGKQYTFKIRSYKTIDGKKVYGSYSSVKWVTIKK